MGLKLEFCVTGVFNFPFEALPTHFIIPGAAGSGKTGFPTVLVEILSIMQGRNKSMVTIK